MHTHTTGTNVLDLYARHTRQLAEEARRLAGHVGQLVDRPAAHDAHQAARHLDALADLLGALER
jgi:hypothetical protein